MMLRLFALASLAVIGWSAPALSEAIGVGNYFQTTGNKICSNATECLLKLNKVPAKMLLIVEHVDCDLNDNGGVKRAAELTMTRGNDLQVNYALPLLLTKQDDFDGVAHYLMTSDSPFLMPGTYNPAVRVFTAAATKIYIRCVVSGTLRKAPAPT